MATTLIDPATRAKVARGAIADKIEAVNGAFASTAVPLRGRPGAELLRRQIDAAIAAATVLRQRPLDEILDGLDRVIADWLAPQSVWQLEAAQRLPTATGFSAAMIQHGLPLQLAPLRGAAIAALLDAELGPRHQLDERMRHASAPPILHILAGNIPALAAAPMILSLALKLPVVVKPASGDPLFAGLLQSSLANLDPGLAACVVVAPWRSGDAAIEAVALEAAGVVVASGADASLAAIARRVRHRFIGHGHRISFAAIDRDSLASVAAARTLAHQLAYDVSLWDQQGCLSPQICWLERGAAVTPPEFTALLAEAMEIYAKELPPRTHSLSEQIEIRRFRDEARWQAGARLWESRGNDAWTLRLEQPAEFLPSPLNRCLRLQPIDDLRAIADLLAPHRRYLEAAGVELRRQQASVRDMLSAAGVHRVCAIGTMQTPTLEWKPGGRPRIAEWLIGLDNRQGEDATHRAGNAAD